METFRIELILLDEEINSFIVVCNNKGHQVNKWYYLACGDGKLGGPNDGEAFIDIPDDLVIKDSHDPVGSLIERITTSKCPGVLGGDTCEGYIFISAHVFLEGTPARGTYSLLPGCSWRGHCEGYSMGVSLLPGVLGGDTYDGLHSALVS
ncbi:hypothetical protein Tco_1262444 [Tanacetum coccineum]